MTDGANYRGIHAVTVARRTLAAAVRINVRRAASISHVRSQR